MRFSEGIYQALELRNLQQYLSSMLNQDIREDKNFSCFNGLGHKNGDRHPSCNIHEYNGKGLCTCFSCGFNSDIFGVCEAIEGTPKGSEENYRKVFDFCGIDIDGDFHKEYESFINRDGSNKLPAPLRTAPRTDPTKTEPTIKKGAEKIEIVERELPDIPADYKSKTDMLRYLKIFNEDDYISYSVNNFPKEQPIVRVGDLINSLSGTMSDKELFKATFGTIGNQGAYVKFNNLDGEGIGDANVKSYKYCLLESDEQSLKEQYSILTSINLPIKFLIYSGNKSIHAIIRVDAKTRKEYDYRVRMIYNYAEYQGLKPDKVCKNPSRYTRLAGIKRGNNLQWIIAEDVGARSFEDFFVWAIEKGIIQDMEAEQIKEYRQRSVCGTFDCIELYNRKTAGEPVRTGFDKLDLLLSGGIRQDLFTILANTGAGKSTFCLQLADQIAKQGNDVLYFSLEMSQAELMSKSLSRITFENESEVYLDKKGTPTFDRTAGASLDANSILLGYKRHKLTEKQLNALAIAEESYNQYNNHLFIESGIGIDVEYIKNRVKEHISITGMKPYIFIDYIQIVGLCGTVGTNVTDKQLIDSTILELKQLANDEGVTVFAISSIPKSESKTELGALSGKNSGLLGFTSATTLTLTSEAQELYYMDNVARAQNVTLNIVKNRYGANNQQVQMLFYPRFSYYQEKELVRNCG